MVDLEFVGGMLASHNPMMDPYAVYGICTYMDGYMDVYGTISR